MATQTSFWKLTNATGETGIQDTADNMGVNYPKLKFNFTVQFVPRTMNIYQGNTKMEDMAFALKTASRPKPTINYQDINFYNFRTKVATSINYGEVSLSFYDDPNNRAHSLVVEYIRTVSPLYGKAQEEANTLDIYGQSLNAGIGPLNTNRHGPMKSIIVTHYYHHSKGRKKVTYEYLNPKLLSADLDDLDMSASEVNLVTLNFTFDTFNATESDV